MMHDFHGIWHIGEDTPHVYFNHSQTSKLHRFILSLVSTYAHFLFIMLTVRILPRSIFIFRLDSNFRGGRKPPASQSLTQTPEKTHMPCTLCSEWKDTDDLYHVKTYSQ